MCRIIQGRNETGFHLSNEDGVTLIEVMVYMVIAGLLLSAAVMTFMGQDKTYNRQDIIAETQQNIRAATQMMVSEIRLAGFDPADKGAGFISATHNSLSFDYWDDSDGDGDYSDETTDHQIIEYALYDAYGEDGVNDDIGRKIGTVKNPLTENIDQLRFEYLYWNYNTNIWVWANDAAAIGTALGVTPNKALELIRAVKIIILGSTRPSAFAATDTTIYKPPLEGGGAATTWTPAAGSGYKRMMSVVVQCRNNRG